METKSLILLAEDDIDDAELLQDAIILLAPHIEVAIVNNGQKVADFLSSCPDEKLPAAIVIDYHMSRYNGPELLEWICGHERLTAIPKFVWGTLDQETYIERCRRIGAVNYFVKPGNATGIQQIAQSIVAHCNV